MSKKNQEMLKSTHWGQVLPRLNLMSMYWGPIVGEGTPCPLAYGLYIAFIICKVGEIE